MPSSNTTPTHHINWLNTIILIVTPLIAAITVPLYWINVGFNWMDWLFFGIFMIFAGLGITGGYHRLWSHKAYDAHPIVKLFYAYWGACAGQNSILCWSADHRDHHKFVDDNEKDPYSAKKGFWYSHIGWIMIEKNDSPDFSNVKDLQNDKVVMWQHKNYLALVLISNLAVPIALGFLAYAVTGSGGIWGTLILAGFLRFVLNHHFTFFINSACHFFGSQPYSNKDTSRDNFLLALVTYGEGYHNFHHTFQADYRNGIRWYHFDPTKWLVKSLNWCGLTTNLRKVPETLIQKQILIHSINQQKDSFYAKFNLNIGQSCQISQKVETLYTDLIDSLNDWLETSQNYFRSIKNNKLSSDERQVLKNKMKDLRKAIETKKILLQEFFNSYSNNNTLQPA